MAEPGRGYDPCMGPEQQQGSADAASRAGEGTWTHGSGTVDPVSGQPADQSAETDALGRDPADTAGHTRNAEGELISDTTSIEDRGHGDGTIEERPDQVSGPSGVQREREDVAVYDPDAEGPVGLTAGDDRNPSDPGSYPDPEEQRKGTSRDDT